MPKSPFGLTSTQKDFGSQIVRLAGIYSSPIILARSRPERELRNGSGFRLTLGNKTFLITNAHVLEYYRSMREVDPNAQFVFGGVPIDPVIISEMAEKHVDLAVIDVTGITFEDRPNGYWSNSLDSFQEYAPSKWPLSPPQTGESTVIVGWPGDDRAEIGPHELEFAALPMLGLFVDDVTDTSFTLRIERDALISSDWDATNPVIHRKAFGGMSGSPVFALHRQGIHPLQLVGVLRAYGENFDLLFCTRADLITRDGAIVIAGSGPLSQSRS